MKIYADTPGLRAKQVLGDALSLVWVALWVLVARFVRSLVDSLAGPVANLRGTGVTLSDAMRKGAASVSDLPMVGDKLVPPFEKGAGAGDSIIRTSDGLVTQIHDIAFWTALLVGVVPIALGLMWWYGRRFSFIRQAAMTRRFLDADADLDLFALRAMANQPLARLDAVSHDPVGAWRRRDHEVIRSLAAMELADAGLHPPARLASGRVDAPIDQPVDGATAPMPIGGAAPQAPAADPDDEPYSGPASGYRARR